jgi:hypothetical protein
MKPAREPRPIDAIGGEDQESIAKRSTPLPSGSLTIA